MSSSSNCLYCHIFSFGLHKGLNPAYTHSSYNVDVCWPCVCIILEKNTSINDLIRSELVKRCLLHHTKTNTNKALLSGSLECYRMSAECVLWCWAPGLESHHSLSQAAVHSLPPSGYETQCSSVTHTSSESCSSLYFHVLPDLIKTLHHDKKLC